MDDATWLVGDDEIVALIRATDWSATALGPLESWPESLRTTVSLTLSSSFPINLIWGDGAVQIWNKAYSGVCGDKHPAEFGSDYRECWASAWPAIGPAFESARAGQTAYLENQPMFLDRNGYLEETWFTFSLSPIFGADGQVAGLFHPVTETSPKMLAERRTRTLRHLAEGAGVAQRTDAAVSAALNVLAGAALDVPLAALYLADPDGTLRLAGQVGTPPGEPVSPTVDPASDRVVAVVVREATPRLLSLTGHQRVEIAAYPEPLERALVVPMTQPGSDRPTGALVLGLSTRLPIDDTYRGFLDLVAQGVTSALANAAAHEHERARAEALAELDRAKTQFFSNVSHEFRTPLTLMLGPLEEALRDLDGDDHGPVRERLEIAHRNSLRLLRLVNSLLDFSRVESGRLTARYVPTDVGSYTADLAALFSDVMRRAGVALVLDPPPLDVVAHVDRELWEKIVLNLVSNAFKHTFEGEIRVGVTVVDDHVQLRVADTGTGIPADELPRLFDRFHRVRDARARSFEGTGIGLALVQELTRLHGGDVAVTSAVGRGSTFTVTIPLGAAHLPAERVERSDGPAVAGPGAEGRVHEAEGWTAAGTSTHPAVDPMDPDAPPRATVLLADDNEDMRLHVARLLAPHFAVTAVADGAAALAAAQADPPDLVLTDVMMPHLDGFELLAALRADPATATTPVIMLSARAGQEAAVEGLAAGADDYVTKPFSPQELIARVQSNLTLAGLRRESHDRLEAANRELAATAAAKGQFLANMSHEIRTPMNAIIGMTSLMLAEPLTDEVADYASVIRSSGEHLLTVINDVLDMSKIGAGLMLLDEAPLSVADCVDSAVHIVRPGVASKRLELTYFVEPDVPAWIVGDAGRLRQILVNLLGNAVKFTDEGEVALTVTCAPGEDDDVELTFAVRDTGIGIAPQDQVRLFDVFEQVDGSDARARQGTGLGLAISQQLAQLMLGRVEVQSAVGQGSTFRAVVRVGRAIPPATADALRPVRLAGRRVLIVDDNERALRIARAYVCAWQMDPVCVGSGAAAVALVEAGERFDVAIVDWAMPRMTGPELVDELRQIPASADLPIVILSSMNASASERDRLRCAGVQLHTKPVNPQALREAVAGALMANDGPQAGPSAAREVAPSRPDAQALTVLVVEDHPVNQRVLTLMLQQLGYRADVAESGIEALEAFDRCGYDVVFMDIQMPGMNGYDATRALRTRSGPRPQIVGLSAHASEDARRACLDAGMDDYVTKPLTSVQLIETLARVGVARA